ncbi:MAG: hypothetical protein AAGD25_16855 [Cyanobacteria bacterium P01_F01_bin.150]
MENTVNLQISLESLIQAIRPLDLKAKQQLLEHLEQQIFEAEEAQYEDDEETIREIEAVQSEYEQGDCMTFDEYLQTSQQEAS